MTIIASILSDLLRSYLWNNPEDLDHSKLESLSTEQWLELHQLSLRQGVCAIVLDAIMEAKIDIPRPIKMRFISSTDKIEKKYYKKVKIAQKLKEIYSEHNIKMMILKGIGLAQLYPVPHHRPCSDIDIWLFGKQIEGDKILREKFNISISQSHHHHTVFHINGEMVENHYDFIEQHSRSSKAAIEKHLKELSNQEQEYCVNIDGTDFYIPDPNLNIFFLIMHSGAHFAAEHISIRHLIDWALFLKHYSPEVNWELLLKSADKFGFRPFLECMNSMCITLIGMPESLAVCKMNNSEIVAKAVEDVVLYKYKYIPENFISGWIFRIKRRFSNSWKQKMVFSDSQFTAFFRAFLTHIIHPNLWRKK